VRILTVIGRKNAGKTTLTVALARELVRRGLRVMTIKHGHHPALVDREGTDTWRHFNEGRAERTLIAGPDRRVLFEHAKDDYDPVGLARHFVQPGVFLGKAHALGDVARDLRRADDAAVGGAER